MLTLHDRVRGRVAAVRRSIGRATPDGGQIAIGFLLTIIVIFMFFAVAVDAGIFIFDHRTAQNQAEAAAQAAVLELPDSDTTAAEDAAKVWLARNGVDWTTDGCSPDWIEFTDVTGEGDYDQVRVCLSRNSSVLFSAIADITSFTISASATALTGRVSIANVMPWAIIPPDPDCQEGETCHGDANGDGDYLDDGDCEGDFDDCPWGLNKLNLYRFKSGGGGNTGIIDACGNGAVGYKNCISGENVSGFFEEGETVVVGLQGGNLGVNTDNALQDRYAEDTAAGFVCDVPATPDESTGYDADGHALALVAFETNPIEYYCRERLVLVPILYSMPPQGGGSDELVVLGVATFGIAAWNRESNQDTYGTTSVACSTSGPDTGFACGMVWGYLMEGLRPPDFLLQKITNSDNPFAPLLVAIIE